MRLIRLAVALLAMTSSWAVANPALNNAAIGSASTTAATTAVAGAAQANLDGARLGSEPRHSRSRSTTASGGMNDSVPSGWLMALVTVLLIGHQLRRKHRFLRPHRFSNL